MGFRTTVILYNDQCCEWSKDPLLGEKIAVGMNHVYDISDGDYRGSPANLHYGNVMECAHADTVNLFAIDSYYGRKLATSIGSWKDPVEKINLEIIGQAADKLGYILVKKR